jgi:hypothetical protein
LQLCGCARDEENVLALAGLTIVSKFGGVDISVLWLSFVQQKWVNVDVVLFTLFEANSGLGSQLYVYARMWQLRPDHNLDTFVSRKCRDALAGSFAVAGNRFREDPFRPETFSEKFRFQSLDKMPSEFVRFNFHCL